MIATFKRMGDGANYEVIIEAQNNEEDAILRSIYTTGQLMAMGQTPREHVQIILTSGLPPR
jgi:hypothetical protein